MKQKGAHMYEFKVDGMSCQGCVKSVTQAIKATDSKANVSVDLASKKVQVQTTLSQKEVEEIIEEAGFTVMR